MKITKIQLRKMILKEFRDTLSDQYNFDNLIGNSGGGGKPPEDDDRGGEPGPDKCSFNNPYYDSIYNKVFRTFGTWVQNNYGDSDQYLEHLFDLGVTMDEISEDYNEFFEILITALADYACQYNVSDLERIYKDPRNAIRYQNNL